MVGGGVMGCATARALATRGLKVLVLERAVPGAEASSAAAGILGAQLESHGPGPLLDALVEARAGYGRWADELRAETGVDIGYQKSGVLRVAPTAHQLPELQEVTAWQRAAGLRAEILTGPGAREVEPQLPADLAGAAFFPDDGQVDPPRLLRALLASLARSAARVTVRGGTTVARLLEDGGRCRGVELAGGERLEADAVVLAAGSWSSLVPGVPAAVSAVRPVRGQMILLEERLPRARVIVAGPSAYVVPRGDGRVLCGSTQEHVGHRKEVTAGGVASILQGALALMPSLEGAELVSTWASFRPESVTGLPLVGPSPLPGLFLATGHHRNGILLARHTAERVAQAVVSP